MSSKNLTDRFKDYLDILIKQVEDELINMNIPMDSIEWIKNALEDNVVGGKMNRGIAVVESINLLLSEDSNIEKAIILGWCIEILQTCFLIADDVMDQSTQRRGKPCWYKQVGLAAVNDSFILQSVVYLLLKKHFTGVQLEKLTSLFLDITFKTELGQLLDLTSLDSKSTSNRISNFSFDRYYKTVQLKTAHYSFVLPVHAALILTDKDAPEVVEEVRRQMLVLGEFFQVQDDYLDFYGNPQKTGKIGTDIEEGKCTWLALRFLQKANKEQREKFERFIGDPTKRNVIAELYNQTELDKEFMSYQAECKINFYEAADKIRNEAVKKISLFFADLIFYRDN